MIKLNPRDQRIIDYLKENRKGLTVTECIRKLKTTELRSAVSRLKKKGFKILDMWEYSVNSFGEDVRYKRYFLVTKKELAQLRKARTEWPKLLKVIQQTPLAELERK